MLINSGNPNTSLCRKSLFAAALILMAVFAIGILFRTPVRNITPYAIAAIIVSLCKGWIAGFIASAFATSIAWLSGAIPTAPENAGLEFDEALITFTELVLASVIASAIANKKRTKNPKNSQAISPDEHD